MIDSNETSPNYSQNRKKPVSFTVPPPISKSMMSRRVAEMYWHLFGPSISDVLDIGCGHGGFAKWRPENTRVTCVDIDPVALATAKIYCNSIYELNLDYEELQFRSESYDGVLARDILEHLREPWKILAEMYRVLRPGGKVIVSVPMPKPKVVWNDYTHVRGFTKKALKKLFEHNRFHVIDIYPVVGFHVSDKLRVTRFLPKIMKIPGAGFFAVSYQLIAFK